MKSNHRDYEPFELGENMEEDLGMFEAALSCTKVELDATPVSTVLAILDHSPRETACRNVSNQIARRLGASLTETTDIDSPSAVLDLAQTRGAGLIILPTHCNDLNSQETRSAKELSLGSLADNLLQTSPIPLLFISDSLGEGQADKMLQNILVVLQREDRPSANALAWAFRLATKQSRLAVLELADRASLNEARRLLEGREETSSIEAAMVGRAVTSRLGGLIGAAQQYARTLGISMQVEFRLGKPVAETIEMAGMNSSELIVIARPDDHTAAGYHLAVDLLLAARQCVLIV